MRSQFDAIKSSLGSREGKNPAQAKQEAAAIVNKRGGGATKKLSKGGAVGRADKPSKGGFSK